MNNIFVALKQLTSVAFFFVFAVLLNQATVNAQPLLQDDFNSFDQSKWAFFGDTASGSVGVNVTHDRTHFNGVPRYLFVDGVNFVRIQLDTHDPDSSKLLGTEMFSRQGFGPPGVALNQGANGDKSDLKISSPPIQSSTGFEFESRLRFTRPISGMVGAFWTYWNHGDRSQTAAGQQYYLVNSPHYRGHEIDFEMLPKQGTNKELP